MDPETIKLLITTCGGPAIIALLASATGAIWYVVKIRAIGNEKRAEQGYTYNLAKEASVRAYGEGVSTREAQQLNEITSAALKQIYGLTDGTLTRMAAAIEKGNADEAIANARILSEMAIYISQIVASLNQTISQNAKIIAAMLEIIGRDAGSTTIAMLKAEMMAALTQPSIISKAVQQAEGVASAAVASEPEPGNAPGEGMAKIEVTGKQVD